MKKVWRFFFGSAFRKGASVLSVLTLGSYVMGLLRDILFAHTFGASRTLDIYNASFIIPDLLINIFLAGALSAAFVPVFTHLWSTGEHEEADRLATTIIHSAFAVIIVTGGAAFLLMPWLVNIVAPGFSETEKYLLIDMSRIMLLSPLIFSISNALGTILVSYERFIGYGLSPLFYNLGIICGIWLATKIGLLGLILGTLFGVLLHLSTRLIALLKTDFSFKFPLRFKTPEFKKFLRLMVPKMIGQPVEQFVFLAFTNLASVLAAGSIAILSFSRNFQSVPVSLFGIAFATAVFSSLSQNVAKHDTEGFNRRFWETAKWLLIASGLSAVFFFFFGELVIKILLGGGKFSPEDVKKTGQMLAVFSFAIPAESLIHLVARSFYALKDTFTTVVVSVAGLIATVVLAKIFMAKYGIYGMPLSYAIVININVIVMGLLLYRKYRRWARQRL